MSSLIISPTTNHGLVLLLSCITIFIITYAQECNPSTPLTGIQPPAGQCDPAGSEYCKAGSVYQTYECSPPVTSQTAAVLTLNSFAEGGDGGGPSECDEQYHSDDNPVVALSTGWFADKARCGKEIVINGNGRTTRAQVVDQCDSTVGCDEEHGFQPPCRNNVVDASKAVWEALGVGLDSPEYGEMDITWSDA